jgi:hypothetical protein
MKTGSDFMALPVFSLCCVGILNKWRIRVNMIKIAFMLESKGRFSAELYNGTDTALVDAFIFIDAPKELLAAVMLLAEGIRETSCRWQTDPGEYRWLFASENEEVILKVCFFQNTFSKLEDESGVLLFSGNEGRRRFCSHIKQQYDRLLNELGPEKYKELWGYEFPTNELNRLKTALHKL